MVVYVFEGSGNRNRNRNRDRDLLSFVNGFCTDFEETLGNTPPHSRKVEITSSLLD